MTLVTAPNKPHVYVIVWYIAQAARCRSGHIRHIIGV